jgi:hypothetical protein
MVAGLTNDFDGAWHAVFAAQLGGERNPILWGVFGFLAFFVAAPALLIVGRGEGRRFPCPYCREGVLDQAMICPHCKGALEWPESGVVWQKESGGA